MNIENLKDQLQKAVEEVTQSKTNYMAIYLDGDGREHDIYSHVMFTPERADQVEEALFQKGFEVYFKNAEENRNTYRLGVLKVIIHIEPDPQNEIEKLEKRLAELKGESTYETV